MHILPHPNQQPHKRAHPAPTSSEFLRDGPLAREVRPPDPLQLCADLIERPIQIQYRHVYQVVARGVGCAGMVFLVSNLIEDES